MTKIKDNCFLVYHLLTAGGKVIILFWSDPGSGFEAARRRRRDIRGRLS
jgi:hypothetical protein